MATKIEDVLQINLVLVGVSLLPTDENRTKFRNEVGTEIVTTEVGIGPETVNRTVAVGRDRIVISVLPDRSTIAREYPQKNDIDRLAQVAYLAITHSDVKDPELRAFGYNLELVYEPIPTEPAILYLSKRLFRDDLFNDAGAQLRGGAARLFFEMGGNRWTASFEPRLQDLAASRIFASFNIHHSDLNNVPTESSIKSTMISMWDEANRLIDLFDGGVV